MTGTLIFPLPSAQALVMDGRKRPTIPLRSMAQLMSRRFILANITDQPISLAQFNCLMAQHAPQAIKQACLMHRAAETIYDPLHGFLSEDGAVLHDAPETSHPQHLHLLPDNWHMAMDKVQTWAEATTNSLLNQLSIHGSPNLPTLPLKRKIKPLPPEDAAWQWAEAMEHLTQRPMAQAV
ncbi:hypothetical protein [Cohaesibacter celericrescens]|uniref:Uncharacterized protein n=1 Tax=Cohaesibacter celericrescens TaxID=2067669 RepID=A0A2N5XX60_9HYPH|nr:hypothetical protein [Cohaesibacter celericrescens]PLW79101.1 hypothetical protein C0081_02395 [Cohaesibacter celericrescens]